ncbi:MAG: TrmB family transcriptional regulator [Candidatus Bathyarchaeia archaeon]
MVMSEGEAVQYLQKIGLTEYEAKVCSALAMIGHGTASEVSKVSGVPRPSVYDVLRGLEKLGIVEVQQGRPMKYRAVPPKILIEKMRRGYEEGEKKALESLERLSESAPERREETIWMIRGRENLRDKIIDMLDRAKKKAVIALPPEDLPDFTSTLEGLKERGVEASLIFHLLSVEKATQELLQEIARSPEKLKVKPEIYEAIKETKKAIPVGGLYIVMIDDMEILLGLRKMGETPEEVAIWARSEGFVTIFAWILERFMGVREK